MSWLLKFCQRSSKDLYSELIGIHTALTKETQPQIEVLNKTPAETYYDQAMIDYQKSQLHQQQSMKWIGVLKSKLPDIQSTGDSTLISNVQKEIASVEGYMQAFSESPPNKAEMDAYFDKDVFEFYADGDADVNEHLIPLMDLNNVTYDFHTFPTGKEVLVAEVGGQTYVIEQGNNQIHYDEAGSWVESAAENPEEYYGKTIEEDFWGGVGPGSTLYHKTNDEYVSLIRKRGLIPMDKTRGLANRSTGSAVFTSDNPDDIEIYGDALIEIDVWKMKQDGYMPDAYKEDVVNESEIKNTLANAIGLEDYYAEHDSDISPTTILFYGRIPPKYLRFPMT